MGEWEHLTIVYDDAEQMKKLYVNGELALDSNDSVAENDTKPFNIGAGQDMGDGFWFKGDIDDIALWSRALSDSEVSEVHANGIPKAGVAERSFTWDFNGDLPDGSDVAGSAEHSEDEGVDGSGALVLTRNVASQSGGWLSPDIGTVDKFKITFDIYIADGTDTQADGLSMAISDDLETVEAFGEEGPAVGGSKLIVCFDNWDNGAAEGPAIDIKWGKEIVATVAMGSQSDSTLDTEGWWPVEMELTPEGNLTILYNGELIHDAVNIPDFASIENARVAFGGRTGGANANQFIDNFKIVLEEGSGGAVELVPELIAYWPFDGGLVDKVAGIEGEAQGTVEDVEGHLGGAVDFGSGNAGNWIKVDAEANTWLAAASDNDALSVSFWQKLHVVKSSSTIWFRAEAAGSQCA